MNWREEDEVDLAMLERAIARGQGIINTGKASEDLKKSVQRCIECRDSMLKRRRLAQQN